MFSKGFNQMARMNLFKSFAGVVAVVVLLFLVGCGTSSQNIGGAAGAPVPPAASDRLNSGDLVIVTFSGIDTVLPQHEERIKEDGTITLSLIGSVKALGKTPGQVQREIRDLYVPKYYPESLNITVKSQDRFFFVGGEVRSPNRYLWADGMTIVKAIQTAGYFTDFAKTSKVRLTRQDGRTFTVNYDKALENPALDVPVYPGDTINVPRRVL
jgi:polysaccharide export outer membrane protein